MTEHRFVFVGGLHRSGTTPLAHALATHAEVSGLTRTGVAMDEGQHLQALYPTARALGGPSIFGFAKDAHLTETSSMLSESARAALLRAWSPFWDLSRPVLLEKSPPNLLRMRFLQAVFPSARFVVIVRHPVAVTLATAKWSTAPVQKALEHWDHCHRLLLEDADHVRALRIVRYEDLVAGPQTVLAGLASFLELGSCADWRRIGASQNGRYFREWPGYADGGQTHLDVASLFGYRLDQLGRLDVMDSRLAALSVESEMTSGVS